VKSIISAHLILLQWYSPKYKTERVWIYQRGNQNP